MQIEIIAAIFDWIFKQQLNLSLFLSDWYCRNLWLADLPSHDGKVTSDMNFISTHMKSLRVQIDIFYMNRCLIVGSYGQRLEMKNMDLYMNLCLEYQSENIFMYCEGVVLTILFELSSLLFSKSKSQLHQSYLCNSKRISYRIKQSTKNA